MGLALQRIEEEKARTPDYWLTIETQRIVVEVKEIVPNKEEQESDRVMRERGYGNALSTIPGDRVRKKISDCNAQIKARSCAHYPSMLVLFDRGFVANHLSPTQIRTAMYGVEQIHIAVPPIASSVSPYITGMSYGPKRKMTEECNTSISAIGVLFMSGPDRVHLHVYHNKFAAVPLDLRLFERRGILQFVLETTLQGNTAKWEEVIRLS
ncbi:MAG: hypothetical protein HY651_10760 [Acidobacteria bacterium]|nr:hypothetical protein [Acidobacteriota bacterium]